MQEFIKLLYTMVTVICVFLSSLLCPATVLPESAELNIGYLEYPKEAVMTLEEAGLTAEELTYRADAEHAEYVQSGGYDDIGGILVSPYYTAKIGETDIPVYASMVFLRSENTGALHSFSEVYVEPDSEFSFNIVLTGASVKLKNAIVLPESYGVGAQCKNGAVTASISKPGIYTFLFNGAQQLYGYTLFVREKVDEDKEIADYIAQYGEENVMIFERGVHTLDYLNFVDKDNQVIYLKQGAYIIANHHYDIQSAEDENKYSEDGSATDNAIGFTRYPFFNFYRCSNIVIAGRGAIDLTRLDRRERRGVLFSYCENISVSDIKIINSPEWSFTTYCCKNVSVEQVDILGHRGNADAFAICNTHNAVIDGCFARTADDEFEVKALGGTMGTENVTFSNCVAWGGYARCFGLTGEMCKSVSDITFRDCAVIYRDGVWDNDRIGSLVVVAEQCEGSIDGVLFENIEIFRDEGRAILVKIYDEEKENFEIKNIEFRNISYTSYMPSKIEGNDSSTNTVQVEMSNIKANGFYVTRPFVLFSVGKFCDVSFNAE